MKLGSLIALSRLGLHYLRHRRSNKLERERWESDLPPSAVQLWKGDAGSVRCLTAGKHVVFAFRAGAEELVLKLSRAKQRGTREVNSEAEWVNYLGAAGLPVCKPRLSVNDRYAEPIEVPGRGGFLAGVNQRSPGAPERMGNILSSPALIEEWGFLAGRIHAASKNFRPSSSAHFREMISRQTIDIAEDIFARCEPRMFGRLKTVTESLLSLPRERDWFGVVHGDLTAANLFRSGNHFTVLDFEGSAYCWFAYDLASPLYSVIMNGEVVGSPPDREQLRRFFRSFITGYVRVNVLPPELVAELPRFLNFLAVLNVVPFYHDGAHKPDPFLLRVAKSAATRGPQLEGPEFAAIYADALARGCR